MKKTLMVMSQEYLAIAAMLEQVDDVEALGGALAESKMAIEQKASGVAYYINQLDDLTKAIGERVKAMNERKRVLENKKERLKAYLLDCMKTAGISKIESPDSTISIAAKAGSANVYDERMIPPEYWKQPPKVLDKAKLLSDLRDGLVIDGATLEKGERISIR